MSPQPIRSRRCSRAHRNTRQPGLASAPRADAADSPERHSDDSRLGRVTAPRWIQRRLFELPILSHFRGHRPLQREKAALDRSYGKMTASPPRIPGAPPWATHRRQIEHSQRRAACRRSRASQWRASSGLHRTLAMVPGPVRIDRELIQ